MNRVFWLVVLLVALSYGVASAQPTPGSGIQGPAVSVIGHCAQWNNTTGTLVKDGACNTGGGSGTVTGPVSSTTNDCVKFADTSGIVIADAGAPCGSGGGGSPGGTTGQIQVNLTGSFAGVSEGTAGQVLISGGAGVAPTFGDPVVSQPTASLLNATVVGGSGAALATAANQTTANTSLATIATNTGAATPAGTNIMGKVGIDQTTPGTTNGIVCNSGCSTPSPITPLQSDAGSSLVLKASAGTLYSAAAHNYSATVGLLMAYNATSAPSPGALTASLVLACSTLPAGGDGNISYSGLPGGTFSTGIVILLSSATDCSHYTTGVITGKITGQAS